jgi:AraC-like DNA-binding protein
LKQEQGSIFDATFATGLSSTSRLHDLFLQIEGMTPAEYKNGGAALTIEIGVFPGELLQSVPISVVLVIFS